MVKLRDLRKTAVARLQGTENDSPKADVDVLLKYLFSMTKSEILLGDRALTKSEEEIFHRAFERLEKGEPVQYIVGGCEFMSLEFEVNSSTLIPRCDTEFLVEEVIRECRKRNGASIMEIGCGSGCIAVSLAYHLPNVRIFALDISEGALKTAEKNAKKHGTSHKIEFLKHDIMTGFPQDLKVMPDIIVSNPPYIPKGDIDALDKKVKDFEPLTALDGGNDGLDFYRKITECARFGGNGFLAFEVGFDQAQAVKEIMSERFSDIKTVRDLNGIERVVTGSLKAQP